MDTTAADVFLSYSRADLEATHLVQTYLKAAGLVTFLDCDQLPAGQPWLPALEQAIARCGAVAVFVGPAGLGTWQQREVQLALDRQAEAERTGRQFPVIPVLLPKVEDPPGGFLKLQTWVDLRADLADPAQHQLLLTGIRGLAPADGSTLREAFCPYRGLLPFREEDVGLFFGRKDTVDTLLDKLREHGLVTLVGRSGSGKSSVVYAGLIPALRRRADGRTWSILSLRPSPEPLHALVRLFDPPPPDLPPFVADQRIKEQVEILRRTDDALSRRIRSLLATADEQGTDRLLLHVDQWEELYTQALYQSALPPEQAEADVARFIDLLLDATHTSPCTVVLTIRADFYGEFLKHNLLAATVPPGQVNLGPMRREDLADAIQEPAKAVGLSVDLPLLDALLDEVSNDLGKLPLLEYALKETWRGREGKRLTLNAYGQAGGIDGAVAKRANDIFTHLRPAEQAAARRLFVSLVAPGEGREDTRAHAVYPEQDDAIRAVVYAFSAAEARLLVTGGDTPSAQRLVEISHEALIREWDLLKAWIDDNRETLRRREHIRARMRQWKEQDRDPTLLLPPGLPLEEGRRLLDDHGDVLIEEVQPYITASIAADEERQRQEEAEAEAEQQRELAAAQRLISEQRKRTRLAIGFSLVVLLLAVVAVWSWQATTLSASLDRARLLVEQGRVQAEARPLLGLRLALEGLALTPSERTDIRTAMVQTIAEIASRARLAQLSAKAEKVYASDDGTMFVIVHAEANSELRSLADGPRRIELTDKVAEPLSLFSPVFFVNDGRVVIVNYAKAPPEVRRTDTGERLARLPHRVLTVFSDDTNVFAVIYKHRNPRAEVRRADSGEVMATLPSLGKEYSQFVSGFSLHKTIVVHNGDDGPAQLRRTDGGTLIATLAGEIERLGFTADEMTFVVEYTNPWIAPPEIRRSGTGAVIATLRRLDVLEFSPQKTVFVVNYTEGPAELRRTSDGVRLSQLAGQLESLDDVTFSPDGSAFVVDYGRLKFKESTNLPTELRRTADGTVITKFPEIDGRDVTFSPDGTIFVGRYSRRSFDVKGPAEFELRRTESGTLLAILAGDIASQDFSLSVGDLNFAGVVKSFGAGTNGVAFSPDGSALAVLYASGRGELWDPRGTPRRLADLGLGLVKAGFVFTSGVERLAVQYSTGQLYLLDIAWLRAMGGAPGQLPAEELVRLACEGPLTSGVWTTAEQVALEHALGSRKPQSCSFPATPKNAAPPTFGASATPGSNTTSALTVTPTAPPTPEAYEYNLAELYSAQGRYQQNLQSLRRNRKLGSSQVE